MERALRGPVRDKKEIWMATGIPCVVGKDCGVCIGLRFWSMRPSSPMVGSNVSWRASAADGLVFNVVASLQRVDARAGAHWRRDVVAIGTVRRWVLGSEGTRW